MRGNHITAWERVDEYHALLVEDIQAAVKLRDANRAIREWPAGDAPHDHAPEVRRDLKWAARRRHNRMARLSRWFVRQHIDIRDMLARKGVTEVAILKGIA